MNIVNGRMPADRLREVEPGMFLEASTAAAYLRAKTASGGILRIAKPAGAYRSYAVQVDMRDNPGKYGLDPASSVPVAAPGSSTHGWGTRVDIAVGAGRTWAIARLGEFGFNREFGSKDPGHFQYLTPSFASVGGTAPIQEDQMTAALYKGTDNPAVYYQERPRDPLVPLSPGEYAALIANGMARHDLAPADMNALKTKWGVLGEKDRLPQPGGTSSTDPAVLAELRKISTLIAERPTTFTGTLA